MNSHGVHNNIVDGRLLPQLIRLQPNLVAASFFLMKIIPAKFILDRAIQEGKLHSGGKIIETSSGTFGLALAMLSAIRGFHLTLVSDSAIDKTLQLRLEDLGTRVEIVPRPADKGGYQQARLDRMAELQHEDPDQFWPSQYHNPQNAGAYAPFAELLVEALGDVDCLIGPVGSGGSTCGTARYLRQTFPDMHLVAVDTMNSVLFGQPDGPRLLRGLGNSLIPQNLDHTLFDEVHWVTAGEAFTSTRNLHRRHALYMGGTSGAAYQVASWWAKEHPDKTVVVIFPDEGYRYSASIYDDDALKKTGMFNAVVPENPIWVDDPQKGMASWTAFEWKKRPITRVVCE